MATKMTTELMKKLYETKQQKRALEALEASLLDQLKALVDPVFNKKSGPISAGGIILTRVPARKCTVSTDKLLERGVSPEVIVYATEITDYFRYLLKEDKLVAAEKVRAAAKTDD